MASNNTSNAARGWQVVESKATRRNKTFRNKPAPPAPPLPDRIDGPVLRPTRHDFRPPLIFRPIGRAGDKFCNVASKILFAHNIGTLAHYLDPIEISPLDFRPQYSNDHHTATRFFALGRSAFMVRVPMFFKNRNRSNEQLMVVIGKSAVPLGIWIERLPKPAAPGNIGERGYERLYQYHKFVAQHKWQKHTFSSMPLDIQNTILLHMVGEVRPVNYCPATCVSEETLALHSELKYHNNRKPRVFGDAPELPPLDPTLLCLNKSINHKIRTIAQCWTIKRFRSNFQLTRLLSENPTSLLPKLNKIQLAFSDKEFFEFFGVPIRGKWGRYPGDEWLPSDEALETFDERSKMPGEPAAALLKLLPSLSYLELYFEPPIEDDTGNPWSDKFMFFPCRKGMVDAIMVATLPYISNIGKINMLGCVKTTSRNFWLDILINKRDPGADPRVLEKRELLTLPPNADESLMKCKCPVECHDSSCSYPDTSVDSGSRGAMKAAMEQWRAYKEAIPKYSFDFDDVQPPTERERLKQIHDSWIGS